MSGRRLVAAALIAAAAASSGASAAQPTESFPTSGLLVFGDELSDDTLFTIAPDGTGLRSLGELEGSEPRWSPDGRLIAYSDGRIRLVRADGSGVRALTRPPRGAEDSSPAWAPGGGRLVYVRSAPSRSGLRTVRADGTEGRWLSKETAGLGYPDWSPDGRRIAGSRTSGEVRGRLWVTNADGSDPQRLGPRTLVGEQPRWSPDGRRIAFVDVEAGVVRVLDLGTNRVRTLFAPEPETYDVEYRGWALAWSPDGRWLAVQWTNAVECVDDPTTLWCERGEIWVVSAKGSTSRRLIHAGPLPSYGDGLDWRR